MNKCVQHHGCIPFILQKRPRFFRSTSQLQCGYLFFWPCVCVWLLVVLRCVFTIAGRLFRSTDTMTRLKLIKSLQSTHKQTHTHTCLHPTFLLDATVVYSGLKRALLGLVSGWWRVCAYVWICSAIILTAFQWKGWIMALLWSNYFG